MITPRISQEMEMEGKNIFLRGLWQAISKSNRNTKKAQKMKRRKLFFKYTQK